ncbi:MAG TPA: GFA family protein [Kofleriaceae bacterium]|nr:GFA family protein [Kofleriaceae bacterium]
MTTPLTGGCACGRVRYELHETPFDTGWCHCRLCQRSAGAPALVFTTVHVASFRITHGAPSIWRSTPFGERGFCATCGALLTIRIDFQPETIDVSAATLDQPAAVTPGFHVFCRDAVPWAKIDDGLPRFDQFRPDTRGLAPGQIQP